MVGQTRSPKKVATSAPPRSHFSLFLLSFWRSHLLVWAKSRTSRWRSQHHCTFCGRKHSWCTRNHGVARHIRGGYYEGSTKSHRYELNVPTASLALKLTFKNCSVGVSTHEPYSPPPSYAPLWKQCLFELFMLGESSRLISERLWVI